MEITLTFKGGTKEEICKAMEDFAMDSTPVHVTYDDLFPKVETQQPLPEKKRNNNQVKTKPGYVVEQSVYTRAGLDYKIGPRGTKVSLFKRACAKTLTPYIYEDNHHYYIPEDSLDVVAKELSNIYSDFFKAFRKSN